MKDIKHLASVGIEQPERFFGIKLYDATHGVKISKRDTCVVEIVRDKASARQNDALESLLEKVTA